jgi:serine/threonine protein phosphatase PrpC
MFSTLKGLVQKLWAVEAAPGRAVAPARVDVVARRNVSAHHVWTSTSGRKFAISLHVQAIGDEEPCGDCALVRPVADGLLVLLADGAGPGAWRASNRLLDTVADGFNACGDDDLAPDARLAAEMCRADALIDFGQDGSTTGIAVYFDGERCWGASSGDSSAKLLGDGLGRDLTYGQDKTRIGVGARPRAFGSVPVDGPLVVGSDGLWRYLSGSAISTLVWSGSDCAAAELCEQISRRYDGLPDDFSAIVISALDGRGA